MLAYIALQKQQHQPSNNNNEHTNQGEHNQNDGDLKVTHTLIENCVGLFRKRRSHRNAMDFDGDYLKSSVLKNVVAEMSSILKTEPK